MNPLGFLPLRKGLPVTLVLLTAVGLGLSLLTAMMLVGLRLPGAAAVMVTMWVVGSVGLLAQGVIGLVLLRGSRRRRSRGQGVER
jgi:hypothetical protein